MRTLVRFYTSNIEPHDHPDPVPAAVIHHLDCPRSAHVILVAGEQEVMSDGWWERFHTEDEAREAAEAHDNRRRDRETYVQYWPTFCLHL